MKNVTTVFLLFSLVLPMVMDESGVFAAENQITLVTQKPQDSPAGQFLDLVYTEAFKRLGFVLVYETLPPKRASLMSDEGEVDGELSRIHTYNEVHLDVIRVEEPHWTSGFVAVATSSSIHLDGWESLKNTDYVVNYVQGIKGCEVNLPKVVLPERLETVNNVTQGVRKVLLGRADLLVSSEMDMLSILESDEFKDSGLRIVGVMEKYTGHAYLHKKHKELVPKVSAVLQEMKKEGLFEKYRNTSKLTTYFND